MIKKMVPKVKRWEGSSPPSEDEIYKVLNKQGVSGYRWANAPGVTYIAHSHSYHKVIYVIQGSITFGLPTQDKKYSLKAGEIDWICLLVRSMRHLLNQRVCLH